MDTIPLTLDYVISSSVLSILWNSAFIMVDSILSQIASMRKTPIYNDEHYKKLLLVEEFFAKSLDQETILRVHGHRTEYNLQPYDTIRLENDEALIYDVNNKLIKRIRYTSVETVAYFMREYNELKKCY